MSDTIDANNPIPQDVVDLVPKVEQRGKVNFSKGYVLQEIIGYGKTPTDGQVTMAKMMVDLKDVEDPRDLKIEELAKRARPVGYAIGFAEVNSHTGIGKNLADGGMMVFTSTVENDGKTAFVGMDKDGAFLIQAGPKSEGDNFLKLMRDEFDQVGEQEENFIVKTKTKEGANARLWNSEYFTVAPLDTELIPQALKLASEESLKAPFISSEDAKLATERHKKTEQQEPIASKPAIKLSEVDF